MGFKRALICHCRTVNVAWGGVKPVLELAWKEPVKRTHLQSIRLDAYLLSRFIQQTFATTGHAVRDNNL